MKCLSFKVHSSSNEARSCQKRDHPKKFKDKKRHRQESGVMTSQLFFHLAKMDQNRFPYIAMHGRVNECSRRGRLRKRWIDSVKKDSEVRGLTVVERRKIDIYGRPCWRRQCVLLYRQGAKEEVFVRKQVSANIPHAIKNCGNSNMYRAHSRSFTKNALILSGCHEYDTWKLDKVLTTICYAKLDFDSSI